MIALGVDAEQIEQARDQAEAFEDDGDREVVVWAENAQIFEVFTNCRWRTQVVAGMAGGMRLFDGIDAAEIRQVCDLLSVPRDCWRDVLWGVRVMEATALPIFNAQH